MWRGQGARGWQAVSRALISGIAGSMRLTIIRATGPIWFDAINATPGQYESALSTETSPELIVSGYNYDGLFPGYEHVTTINGSGGAFSYNDLLLAIPCSTRYSPAGFAYQLLCTETPQFDCQSAYTEQYTAFWTSIDGLITHPVSINKNTGYVSDGGQYPWDTLVKADWRLGTGGIVDIAQGSWLWHCRAVRVFQPFRPTN